MAVLFTRSDPLNHVLVQPQTRRSWSSLLAILFFFPDFDVLALDSAIAWDLLWRLKACKHAYQGYGIALAMVAYVGFLLLFMT